MNLRQRRGVLFLAAASVFLLIGASSLGSYVGDVNDKVGPMVEVAAVGRDIEPYTALTEDDIGIIEVPRRWVPERAFTTREDAIGLVATTPLGEGAYLTEDILVPRPELEPGQREIAILIDAETGVAGKVRPGSRVDIVATFRVEGSEAGGSSAIIVSNAQVIDVGDLQVSEEDDEEGFQQSRVVPVTFALSIQEALILTHAESFAQKVRLALMAPDDIQQVPPGDRIFPPEDAGSSAPAGEG